MKQLQIGVFLPIARNGFVRSRHAPAYVPSFRDLREITCLAEEIGLDYAFSMAKWRGYGGDIHYWDSSFESFSLMSALIGYTTRLRLLATVNPLLHHPASMAKMATTIQDASQGRLGLNIVTGAALAEYEQMGIVPEGYDQKRYAYAAEWVHVLKRLWAEPRVTHHGEFFHLEDCFSDPNPAYRPFLVCAGTSDDGLRFGLNNVDDLFLSSPTHDGLNSIVGRARELAAEAGRPLRMCTPVLVVLRDTAAEARAWWDHLVDGADLVAGGNRETMVAASTGNRVRVAGASVAGESSRIATMMTVIGGPREVADVLVGLVRDQGMGNVALLFPDYVDGLRRFAAGVMPTLREVLDI